MSNYESNACHQPCEFVVPIKLTVPIEIEPKLTLKFANHTVKQKLPVYLQPNIHLEPEVLAAPTECYPVNGCH